MKFHKNKFLTSVSAIALVLAVGACGSSSNDDEMALVVNGDGDATNGDGDATNGDGDATNGGDAATNGGDAATNGGDDTKTPVQTLAAAQAVYDTLPADATDDVRAAAMTALVAALMLEGNEAEYLVYLEKKVADQAQAIKDEDAATAAKDASAMARGILEALGDVDDTDMAPAITPAASSAGKLTVKATDYAMSESAPDEITGWRGAILTKDGAEVHVYTNIDDSKATPIGDIYGIGANKDPGEPVHYDVVNEVGAEGTLTEHDIPWSVVKRADADVTETGTGETQVSTFSGNVRGLDGMFSCTGTTCTAPTVADEETVLARAAGTWTFVPTDPDGTIDVADRGYLTFGWWLNQMDEDEQVYQFDAFASASTSMMANVETSGEDGLEGSATYNGGAAGKFAMKSTSDDSASGGHFTATATLKANFNANTDTSGNAADANENGVSVSGTITNFMTGDVSRDKWKVTLKAPTATGNVAPITDAVTEWATGGALKGAGTWSANFYGTEKDTDHPTDVTGEFNAAIPGTGEVARIVGAFGATK